MKKMELKMATTSNDFSFFWQKWSAYMCRDILNQQPADSSQRKEEQAWFFSREYHDLLMELFQRKIDQGFVCFFMLDGKYAGFVDYVIYTSEDGKGFILDYCVEKKYRDRGYGSHFFELLQEKMISQGSEYFQLNLSTAKQEKFWQSKGFFKIGSDEYEDDLYQKGKAI